MSRFDASRDADLPVGTLPELFFAAVDQFGSDPAFLTYRDGAWRPVSYRQANEDVKAVTFALRDLGLRRGDRAAILSYNRLEWAVSDYGCLCAGVRDVPVYATLPPAQIRYILENSGARLVFVSDEEQLDKIAKFRKQCPDLEHVVVMDVTNSPPEWTMTWADFLERGRAAAGAVEDEDFRASALEAEPDEVATILYTSGTTGPPKGVMLTHNNLYSNVEVSSRVLSVHRGDRTVSFLPLSHVFQRMVDYLLLSRGCSIAHARSIYTSIEDMKVIRPTVVVSVPRVYEKIYSTVMEQGGLKGRLVRWAVGVGGAWFDEVLAGGRPGPTLALNRALADRLVFRKIRSEVGGNIRWFVSGGAPLSPTINRFFHSVGLVVLEGYGLTETSPVTHVNSEDDFRIGTVGRPVPGTEIRIAEDGEILVRGPQVMKGYFNQPEATAEVLTEDGWFHTGDLGELEEDGFLRITDRKKDIIVTAGGKNIAPQHIENRVINSPFIDQVVMVGDRRRFPSLLVVPNFPKLGDWAGSQGIATADPWELLQDARVGDFLRGEIMGRLKNLARFETPKKIGLLRHPFSIEDGTMTPSLKVKRRVVEDKYAELIESFYAESAIDMTVFVA
jgi:long-chain acyl-CoA synthetase